MEKQRNAKGEGSFKTNPDGTVTHRKTVGYKANGYRKILTVTANNKAACIKEMKKREAAWEKEKASEQITAGTTLYELCQKHLRYQVEQDELKPKSIDRRECTIENHIGVYPLGRMQLQNVKVADIDDHVSRLIQERTLSASSIEKVVDVLNAAYKWALMRGEVEFNPVLPIKPTLVKRIQKLVQKSANDADVDVLSEEEEACFEKEARKINERTGGPQYESGLFGLLLLHTGMRCGEMLALRWSDVDWEKGILTIEKSRSVARNRNPDAGKKYIIVEGSTKNSKARKIKLKQEAVDILTQLRERTDDGPEELIVKTRTGKANTATNLEHRMATIFKNAGLPDLSGGLHIFRRTFATRMYENGARVKEIAAYIGDLESTTERYYIAVRKKITEGGETQQVVMLPVRTKEQG